MTGIKNIQLHNVRSHTSATFEFVETMNAVVGPNGSGKTTLLESLYTLLRGSSFKGSLGEIAQYGTNQFRMQLKLNTGSTEHIRSLGLQQIDHTTMKKWSIDHKKYARLPMQARLPVVLFEPDLARLISGSPERRRSYLDQLAAQIDTAVAFTQNRFERTLKQRNQLLKKLREKSTYTVPDELFIWNTQLAHLSEQIIEARCALITALQKEISSYYKQLGGSDNVLLTYQSAVSSDPQSYASKLLQFFETSVQRDIALGYTSFGPHRDDLEVRLSDQLAIERASRGEVRTLVIAFKLLETELLAQAYVKQNIRPTLLLDDVLSELDLVHQERVLEGFKNYQVFITTTDAHALTPGVHTVAL